MICCCAGTAVQAAAITSPEALRKAIESGKTEEIESAFLEGGLSAELRFEDGMTPLGVAVKAKKPAIVDVLLTHGASTGTPDAKGRTPFHYAVLSKKVELLEKLLPFKAGMNTPETKSGDTPLHFAIREGQSDLVKTLLQGGADLYAENTDGDAPLFLAIARGEAASVETLVKGGVDLTRQNPKGQTPLIFALQPSNSQAKVLLALAEGKLNLADNDETGATVLHYLAERKIPAGEAASLIEQLVAKGAPLNAVDGAGRTPLGTAIKAGNKPLIAALEKLGAFPSDAPDPPRIKETPVEKIDPLIVEEETEEEAPVDTDKEVSVVGEGDSSVSPSMALALAVRTNDLESLNALLSGGESVNTVDGAGFTLLHLAAMSGKSEAIKALLKAGAKPDAKTPRQDWTPLHLAAQSGSVDAVKALLEAKAEVNTPDIHGRTALDFAMESGDEESEKVLKAAGGKPGASSPPRPEVDKTKLAPKISGQE